MDLTIPQLIMVLYRGKRPPPRLTDAGDIKSWIRQVKTDVG